MREEEARGRQNRPTEQGAAGSRVIRPASEAIGEGPLRAGRYVHERPGCGRGLPLTIPHSRVMRAADAPLAGPGFPAEYVIMSLLYVA